MKRFIAFSLKVLALFISLIGFYVLSAWVLSRITVDPQHDSNDKSITAYILSNGVHTDIVLPVQHSSVNWGSFVRADNTKHKDTTMSYVAFGWGDKGFYLETPTWNDLSCKTAFKAAFGLSSSAMHVTYYKSICENDHCKAISISEQQYIKLTNYIKESFLTGTDNAATLIETTAVYGNNDAFYEAKGSYSLFKTCNTWTNNALKQAGCKACLWTPFESGIFYQLNN